MEPTTNQQETNQKATFEDSQGNEWHLRFDLGMAMQLRDTVGFDIADLKEGKAFLALANDLGKFAALLWMLCEKQAEALGIVPEEFYRVLDGEAMDAAQRALEVAVVNFSPSWQREGVAEMVNQANESMQKAGSVMKELAKEKGQQIQSQLENEIRQELDSGNTSPPLPPSQEESTTDP